MELKVTTLSEISQVQKNKYHMFAVIMQKLKIKQNRRMT
jgi:hypothetical protein